MANSADPDQLASSEANWSGSTLFVKAGYIWVQQDKGLCYYQYYFLLSSKMADIQLQSLQNYKNKDPNISI